MNKPTIVSALVVLSSVLVSAVPVRAAQNTYLEGGAYLPSQRGVAAAGVLTETLPLAVPGAAAQGSLMVPFATQSLGRYALTGEVRTTGRAYFGVGGGFGKINYNTGLLVEAFAGVPAPLVPNTWVVVRFYAGDNAGVGTTGFAGLKIRL